MDKKTLKALRTAAEDVRYLLTRGFKKDSSIRFVCDHYRLPEKQRRVLIRTIVHPEKARNREYKKIPCTALAGLDLIMDGYNVIITVESMLRAYTLWLADDGYIRDTRGVFRSFRFTEHTRQAIEIILEILRENDPEHIEILLDAQMSKSGELAAHIREMLPHNAIIRTSPAVDLELKNSNADVVATADGAIVDVVKRTVDIPQYIMKEKNIEPMKI